MAQRIWILGAPDPEMEAIESLLIECGETVVHATSSGKRVHPGNAYRADIPSVPEGAEVYAVECVDVLPDGWYRIDHHRPGDPGFGRPPEEFLSASSMGQVIGELARLGALPKTWGTYSETRVLGSGVLSTDVDNHEIDGELRWHVAQHWRENMARMLRIPRNLIMIAAADHCLGAAYAGKCPGVDTKELGRFRAEERARFSGRDVRDVLSDIERTTAALMRAGQIVLAGGGATGCGADHGYDSLSPDYYATICAADMRRDPPWPELPEAATRAGISYVSGPLECPDGRKKITCSGTREVVEAFMTQWGPAQGLTDIYGDSERGFAGGYE